MSSFTKRRVKPKLPGARQGLHAGLDVFSTGTPSLDSLIGGGIQNSSLLLVEQDKFATTSKMIAKAFIAEGVVHQHRILIANLDEDLTAFAKKIPEPIPIDRKSSKEPSTSEDMRIAWRYNVLDQVNTEEAVHRAEYCFRIDDKTMADNPQWESFVLFDLAKSMEPSANKMFINRRFANLLQAITEEIEKLRPPVDSSETPSVLRICICGLGSPMWCNREMARDIKMFLICLKGLVRNSNSICCITTPMYLVKHIDDCLPDIIRYVFDYSIELESFVGSEREQNPLFREYKGLVYIRRLIALNSLNAYTPKTFDWAYKIKRKVLSIEVLHLPPELDEVKSGDIQKSAPSATMGCATNTKHLLEF